MVVNGQPRIHELRRKELERIAKKHGVITPLAVVDAARNKKNPLHDFFEWNDSKAAGMHRLEQARSLIRMFRFEIEGPSGKGVINTRIWVVPASRKSKPDGSGTSQYRNIQDVMRDDQERDELMSAARRDLATFRRKYAALSKLAEMRGVFRAIGDVLGSDDKN